MCPDENGRLLKTEALTGIFYPFGRLLRLDHLPERRIEDYLCLTKLIAPSAM